jgi:hypothetical protein
MANSLDVLTCSNSVFLQYLEETNLKEQTFKELFTKFNEKYISVSTEIMKLNDVRAELLEKIKYSQAHYKRLLGHGEIKPVTDVNDDEEVEKTTVQEEKVPDKRGRKKIENKDSVDVVKNNVQLQDDEADDPDLENIPKMKSKEIKKKTKKTDSEQENDVQEDKQESDVEVKTATKTSKSDQKVETKSDSKAVKSKTTKLESDKTDVEVQVVAPVTKAKKTATKSSKKETTKEEQEEGEQGEQEQVVAEVKTKTTKKKSGK